MIDLKDTKKIKEITEEFFQKTTIPARVEIRKDSQKDVDTVVIDVKIDTPEILIGEKGQTLIEIQRLLKIILNKKIEKSFYIDLDINDYKKKKIDYLKDLAKDLADEAVLTKEEKVLFPMSAYERRIIHLELAERADVTTESQGEGFERKVVIKPC